MAHYNLGMLLLDQDRLDEAMPEFQKTVQLKPAASTRTTTSADLRRRAARRGHVHYPNALKIKPSYVEARNNLGVA